MLQRKSNLLKPQPSGVKRARHVERKVARPASQRVLWNFLHQLSGWAQKGVQYGKHQMSPNSRFANSCIAVVVAGFVVFGASGLVLNINHASAAISDLKEGDGVLTYGLSANNLPKYKLYTQDTDSFGTEQNTQSNSPPFGQTLRTNPIKPEAILMYAYDSDGTAGTPYSMRVMVMCYDGNTWSRELNVAIGGDPDTRRFDVQYEHDSGKTVIMYVVDDANDDLIGMRTKPANKGCNGDANDGTNWTTETTFNSARTNNDIEWIKMAQDPTSDALGVIWADISSDLSAGLWNGSTIQNEPTAALETSLEQAAAAGDVEAFELTYESLSGDLMVAWGQSGTGAGLIEYAMCNGGGSGCTWAANADVPTVADTATAIDIKSNPLTDQIALGAEDNSSDDLSAAVWSGTAWTGTANLDTSVDNIDTGEQEVQVIWLINGSTTRAVMVFGEDQADAQAAQLNYYVYNGTNWGTANTPTNWDPVGTGGGTTAMSVNKDYYKTTKDPFNNNRAMVTISDDNGGVWSVFSKSVSMDSAGTLTWANADGGGTAATAISSKQSGPFGFAYWANVPVPSKAKITQQGYIIENDDEDQAGGDAVDENTQQAAGNTAITAVKKGERITLRFQIENSGVDALAANVGLFYDKNDGYFTKVRQNAPPVTAAGNCTSTQYDCGVVDNDTDNTGQYGSMAMDSTGRPWVAYYDATATSLMLAHYVGVGGSGCGASGSSEWSCMVVDNDTDSTGQYASIALAPDGNPWISYFDATTTSLMVAEYVGSGGTGCGASGSTAFTCTQVDNNGTDTGEYSSIAFDKTGKAAVSYRSLASSLGDVKLARWVGTGGGCTSAAWNCTLIDNSTTSTGYTYTSLAFAHSGFAYIAYYDGSATAMRVAREVDAGDGTGCGTSGSTSHVCSAVDNTADTGQYASIAFGPSGNPWISYFDNTNSSLRVATTSTSFGVTCTDNTWQCGAVDADTDNTGKYSSIQSGPDGRMWVSYYDDTTDQLMVARFVGASGTGCGASGSGLWTCLAVDNTGTDTGQYTSIAFDAIGNPWISHYDTTNTGLRVAQVKKGGEIVISPGLSGVHDDTIQESHADMTAIPDNTNRDDADCVNVDATWNNGRWHKAAEGQTVTLPSGLVAAQCTEVAYTIDTSQATLGQVYRFAVATSDNWRLDKGRWRGPIAVTSDRYATVTIDATVQVRYSKDNQPDLAACTDTTWGCQVADNGTGSASPTSTNVGQYNSTAFDSNGRAWVSTYDTSNTALRIARYVGSGGTGCGGSTTNWSCVVADNAAATGDYSSIGVSPNGTVWTAYRTAGTTLKVARYVGSGGTCTSSEWTCVDIETTGASGAYTAIAFDALGNPWVVHQDTTNNDLRLARFVGSGGGCGAGAWECSAIDNGAGTTGQHASIGFDKNNMAWVSYYDGTDLRVAQYVGAGGSGCATTEWTCSTVENTNNSGQYSSLAFDASGNPWIGYYVGNGVGDLRVAQRVGSGGSGCTSGGGAWTCTQVDVTGDVGQYAGLAFDSEGKAVVSYYDVSNTSLKYARNIGSGGTGCNVSSWACTTVDNAADTGQFSSVAFDMSGVPQISYYDNTNDDLKVARLKMQRNKPSPSALIDNALRGAGSGDARYRMDAGYSPRTSTSGCAGAASSSTGYCGVSFTDANYDTIITNANERGVFLFSTLHENNTDTSGVTWIGWSSEAGSTSAITLEVYRFGTTNAWETVSTNAGCAANSECSLTGSPTGPAGEYYEADGGSYRIHYRVWQASSANAITFKTNSFYPYPTMRELMRHGKWFSSTGEQPFFWSQI